MPADYSWVSNTTSESAAQGVQGAWMARLGFVLFGMSVILLVAESRRRQKCLLPLRRVRALAPEAWTGRRA
jgi:hypothetical protein